MSTLVNYLLAAVLSFLQTEATPETVQAPTVNTTTECSNAISQQLKPHYLITRAELLTYLNENKV